MTHATVVGTDPATGWSVALDDSRGLSVAGYASHGRQRLQVCHAGRVLLDMALSDWLAMAGLAAAVLACRAHELIREAGKE